MAAEDRHEEVFTDEECIDCTERERSFDAVTRGLANGSISRRKALRMLGAALVGSALASIPGVALAKPPPGACKELLEKCAANTECCSKNCIKNPNNPESRGKICGCPTGQTLCGNQCIVCTSPKVINLTNCQCVCPTNAACTGSGGMVNSSTCACECPGDKVLNPSTGQCVQCNSASDCPQPTDQCLKATCTNNVCGFAGDEGKPCNDNNSCIENEKCTAAGACLGDRISGCVNCQTDQDCSMLEVGPCKVAFCQADNVCGVSNKDNGTGCNADDNACTVDDTCQNGTCTPGQLRECPQPNDPCLVAVCDPTSGDCVTQNAPNDTLCEDGDLCTVGDTCQNGTCQAGDLTTCPDTGNQCTVSVCNPQTGMCEISNKDNGTGCNADDNACTVNDTCQNGTCTPGQPRVCEQPANECQEAVCIPATGDCEIQNLTGTLCDTGNKCTADICQNGQCQEGELNVTCVDEQCQRCNPATGSCDAVDNGTSCELDDNPCTLDTCQAGVCTAGGLRQCQQPANECQEAVCNPATGNCETENLTGTPCDTGNQCTADICQAGQCEEGDVDVICTDLDEECKVGVCDPTTGQCITENLADDTPCTDEDLCTTDDSCQNGVCRGTPVSCPTCQTCSAATGTCVPVICSGTLQVCCATGTHQGTCKGAVGASCTGNGDCCNNNCTRNPGGAACRSTDTGCLCRA